MQAPVVPYFCRASSTSENDAHSHLHCCIADGLFSLDADSPLRHDTRSGELLLARAFP